MSKERRPARDLVQDLSRLFEAEQLLESLWSRIDPYDQNIPFDLMQKLKSYFKFDDSE